MHAAHPHLHQWGHAGEAVKTHEDVDEDRSAEGVERWPQQLDNHEAIGGKRKMNACALYSMTSET